MTEKRFCLNCNKELSNYQMKYCSNQCQKDFEYKNNIQEWQQGKMEIKNKIPSYIRRYLFEKHQNKCELCGWGETNPITHLIPLEIHHIDGDHFNNNEDNLQLLCPNCHSLTPNFKALNDKGRDGRNGTNKNLCKDCGKPISFNAMRCKECETKRRIVPLENMPITREELKYALRTESFLKIAHRFNITDNAIRKWCDKFNLPRTKKEINSYSDEEWEKI